jgi:hypothetical protein
MTSDRHTHRRRLRVVEVMTVTDHDHANGQHSTAQIARLFDIAGREDEALALLDGCVSQLRQVQAARKP